MTGVKVAAVQYRNNAGGMVGGSGYLPFARNSLKTHRGGFV